MRLPSDYPEHRARIEMIPLIDIVFMLLVFFIYAMLSMVVHRGLKVELPAATTAQVDKRDYVDVAITRENAITVDGEPCDLADLATRVAERRGSDASMPVFISGDREADLGLAVKVLDTLRAAGIREAFFACAEEGQK